MQWAVSQQTLLMLTATTCNPASSTCSSTGLELADCRYDSTASNLLQVANLTYCVHSPTQPPALGGMQMSSSMPSVEYGVKVDRVVGMSASQIQTVRKHVQWMAVRCTAVPLRYTN